MIYQRLIRIWKRSEKPQLLVEDPELGRLTWSPDEDSWIGTYLGRDFSLAYEEMSAPSRQVLAYATRILNDSTWLEHALTKGKAESRRSFSTFYTSEIESLTLATAHFSIHPRRGEYALIDLDGGLDFRAWRMELSGSTLVGIGVDS